MRQLLVVDEVHASDPYMERLLRGVLQQHVAAGGHALLMSATLGAAARARLLDVTARAAVIPSLAEARVMPYPALHVGGGPSVPLKHTRDTHTRTVGIGIEDVAADTGALVTRLLAAASAGARVLVIRNTVAGAIAAQQALEAAAGPDSPLLFRCRGVPAPHHSRFAAED